MIRITRIPIPDWAYEAARQICSARQRRYRHQFITAKLKEIAGDDEILKKDIEGVYGYLGDICACSWLHIDPKEELRAMVLDTNLLTHRDEYDVLYRGWRLDIKTEIYPDEKFERAIRKKLDVKETYGCRLININHFLENSATVDGYIFSTLDNNHPGVAKNWIPIGWIYKDDVTKICPEPMGWSPSGARLWTKAYAIPNSELHELDELENISKKPNASENSRLCTEQRIKSVDAAKYEALVEQLGID
ncbi:hypothetical protein E3J62_10800 [candidate division TA06 bacterium]|uniref:Uncharacterized protein n=1 Tax=candidate division TA06 bacterium TaxID=2250710 RepID=A0A523UPR5_UNCT6|nr:MAG: hypothetical protein E3J62_10800 [candidate division TA06 bacterium]